MIPDYTLVAVVALAPALVVFAFTGVPGAQGGVGDILYWHRVNLIILFVGGPVGISDDFHKMMADTPGMLEMRRDVRVLPASAYGMQAVRPRDDTACAGRAQPIGFESSLMWSIAQYQLLRASYTRSLSVTVVAPAGTAISLRISWFSASLPALSLPEASLL